MTTPIPGHVPCRHCGKSISWDEICWTHDDTGFADCHLTISGGTLLGIAGSPSEVLVEPTLSKPVDATTRAEPVGAWS